MLWNRSLVMRDVETGSLWSHLLGRCMAGDLMGTELKILPSVMTTWEDWRDRHPNTSVLNLSRTAEEFDREVYSRAERFVFGIRFRGKTKAYPLDVLAENPLIQETFNDRELVVVFDSDSTRTAAYERRLDDQVLDFGSELKEGKLVDKETGSHWDPWTGKALSGPSEGTQLARVNGIISYRRAWQTFYPETAIAGSGDD
jgi:hypothetical protein